MRFPISTLDKTEYLAKINLLLNDKDCQLFIDTNVLGLLFRIYKSARNDFFEWVFPMIQNKRFNIPLWVVNEYTNRFIRNQIDDYFSPLKKIKSVKQDFTEIGNFLRMNIDSASLNGTRYESVEGFIDDLKDIEEKFKKISVVAKAKDELYKIDIHNEIQRIFEETIIDSDIISILAKVREQGQIRYDNRMPPGFGDDKKEQNSFGDLIIWFEILELCKLKNIKKVLLITNDNKKDWVYTPQYIRNIYNEEARIKNLDFKIADTRLIHEFKHYTNSEEFYIINFETLTQLLVQSSNGRYVELAKALQIVNDQNQRCSEVNVDESSDSLAINRNSVNEVLSPEITISDSYSEVALADSGFLLDDFSEISKIIIDLKSYNWYIQNPALERLEKENVLELKVSEANKNKLFVLGRNIYQTACGGSIAAIEIIRNLDNFFIKYSDFVVNHIYSGILYEIYFNSKNEFRYTDFKSTFFCEVFNLKEIQRLSNSIGFISGALRNYWDKLIVIPSIEPEIVKISVEFSEKETGENIRYGGMDVFHRINDIKLNDISIITGNTSENVISFLDFGGSLRNIKNLLSNIYLIPVNQMNIVLVPDKCEIDNFSLEPRNIKNLQSLLSNK